MLLDKLIISCLLLGDEDDDPDADVGSVTKKRRGYRSVKVKKSTGNKLGCRYSFFALYYKQKMFH